MGKQTTNNFETNFSKLMSNACFGQTMENLKMPSKVKFVSNPQHEAFAQRATFKFLQFFRQDLVCVSFKISFVAWTKSTPVGPSMLDLSNLSLYKFHYAEMVPRYSSSQLKAAFKDTDSPLYLIDLYKEMASFNHLLGLPDN